ncbi:MAG: magnesium transporter [Gammaproteobacteria bacterium]
MTEFMEQETEEQLLDQVVDAIEREAADEVGALLDDRHPGEIALVLESLPSAERDVLWELIDPELHAEVLTEVDDSVRTPHMLQMAPEALAAIARDVDDDDAADLLQDLPKAVSDEVLQAMGEQERTRLESILAYPEDTAGGLMNLDAVTVRADVTVETVLRYLRARGEIPQRTNRLYVVDRENHYQGELRLAALLTNTPDTLVESIMDTEQRAVPANESDTDVARMFEQRNLISAAVVDEDNKLIGRITVDDVVDVIRDEGEQSVKRMAGLGEDDNVFAPVIATSVRRAVWLGVNLATALLASWVIGRFEATIGQLVALAVLMPVVASMGGIAGSQTLTIAIRGIALGQLGPSNTRALLVKETLVGLLNSLLWALVVGLVAAFWFDSAKLGWVIGFALIANLLVAAVAGALIPMGLRKISIDPALAGGVILTTVTDVVGFAVFLGLGTVMLLQR